MQEEDTPPGSPLSPQEATRPFFDVSIQVHRQAGSGHGSSSPRVVVPLKTNRPTLSPSLSSVQFGPDSGRAAGQAYGVRTSRSASRESANPADQHAIYLDENQQFEVTSSVESVPASSVRASFRSSRENAPMRALPVGLISAKYAERLQQKQRLEWASDHGTPVTRPQQEHQPPRHALTSRAPPPSPQLSAIIPRRALTSHAARRPVRGAPLASAGDWNVTLVRYATSSAGDSDWSVSTLPTPSQPPPSENEYAGHPRLTNTPSIQQLHHDTATANALNAGWRGSVPKLPLALVEAAPTQRPVTAPSPRRSVQLSRTVQSVLERRLEEEIGLSETARSRASQRQQEHAFLVGAQYNHPHLLNTLTPRTSNACIYGTQGALSRSVVLDGLPVSAPNTARSATKGVAKLSQAAKEEAALLAQFKTEKPKATSHFVQYKHPKESQRKGRLFARKLANVRDEDIDKLATTSASETTLFTATAPQPTPRTERGTSAPRTTPNTLEGATTAQLPRPTPSSASASNLLQLASQQSFDGTLTDAIAGEVSVGEIPRPLPRGHPPPARVPSSHRPVGSARMLHMDTMQHAQELAIAPSYASSPFYHEQHQQQQQQLLQLLPEDAAGHQPAPPREPMALRAPIARTAAPRSKNPWDVAISPYPIYSPAGSGPANIAAVVNHALHVKPLTVITMSSSH